MSAITTDRFARYWAIRFVFMTEAMVLGAWLPRIPDIKNALSMDAGLLGLVLVGLPAGTLAGFVIAAQFAEKAGLRKACMISGSAFALSFIGPGLAPSPAWLFAALFVCGFFVALIEVSMNTKAGQMERQFGRRLMSQCHGFWSIGTVIGAIIGGAFAQAGIPVSIQFLTTMPVFAVFALIVAAWMPPDNPRTEARERTSFFVLPEKALIVLCLMPIGIMALEGAMMDWSAVFVREVLTGQPAEAAAAYAVFSSAMAVTRLAGDHLAERFGAARVVFVSCISAAIGAALFASAPGMPLALLGSVLAGFGVATVYPLAVSAAAAAPGKSQEANVAAVSFIAFSIFLAGPPLIGGLADQFGLRIAMAILVPAALVSASLAGTVKIGRSD